MTKLFENARRGTTANLNRVTVDTQGVIYLKLLKKPSIQIKIVELRC